MAAVPVMRLDDGSKVALDVDARILPFDSIEIGQKLGQGSFGTVYLGRCQGMPVAVKVCDLAGDNAAKIDEARHEMKLMMGALALAPTRVVAMKAWSVEKIPSGVRLAMLMSAYEGSLDDYKIRKGSLRLRLTACRIVAEAFRELNGKSAEIVHQDLKPANVLYRYASSAPGGPLDLLDIRIADFGMARIRQSCPSGGAKQTMWAAPTNGGTLPYMAPEHILGEKASSACDVYAWAIMTWELLSMQMPYRAEGVGQRVSNGDWEWVKGYVAREGLRPNISALPVDVNPYIIKLVQRGWDADPANRPTFAEIGDTMARCGVSATAWRKDLAPR